MSNSDNNKKLIKNVLLFALSNFVPKVLSFLLVPIYTSYLTTQDYGTSDLIITTASLVVPIFTISIDNAVIRFTIENKEDKRAYRIAIDIFLIGSIALAIILGAASIIFKLDFTYMIFVFILFAVSALYQIKVAYLRGMERISFLTACGIISSFVSLTCNIVFITVFKWGLYGFVLASIAGYLIVDIIVTIHMRKDNIYKIPFNLNSERSYLKEMVSYSFPLVFSGLSWWINSVSDRYFVTWMLGVSSNGIYSVAYKIPTILSMVQAIFAPAWTLSVYEVYNQKDGNEYISKIYDMFNFIMVFACSGLIFINIPLAKFLYSNEFYQAWKYVPALLISVVFIGMGACATPILSAYKKSKLTARGSIYSATTNIILNFVLINYMGIQGAAIATAISYFVSWIYSITRAKKSCDFYINWKKHGLMYVLLIIESLIVVYCKYYWLSCVVVIIILMLCRNNAKQMIYKSKDMIKSKLGL